MFKTILGILGLIAIGTICLFVVLACAVNTMMSNKSKGENEK